MQTKLGMFKRLVHLGHLVGTRDVKPEIILFITSIKHYKLYSILVWPRLEREKRESEMRS